MLKVRYLQYMAPLVHFLGMEKSSGSEFFSHYQLCIYQYEHSAVLLVSPQMYHFTNFAMALNEMEPGMEAVLAPTDCRFRPDIRAMENGNMGNLIFMF